MIKLDITISNNTLRILQNAFSGAITDPNVMQATKKAFNEGAHIIQNSWKDWANGAKIPGAEEIKNPSPKLAQSIKTYDLGPLDKEIGTNSRYMERIISGQEAYDMKETYPFGRKSRRTKDGRGYLIIPFRWGTPNKDGSARAHFRNVIPQELYKEVKKYKVSVITGETHLESNYRGELLERQEYFWGDRLKDEDAGMLNGLVRMPYDKEKGEYFTFRIITERNSMNGDKWWKKAVPPNDVPMALVQNHEKQIADLVEHGILEDLGLDAE